MRSSLTAVILSLYSLASLAAEEGARKPPQVDPLGIAIFVGVLVIALGWLIWRVRRSAVRKQDKP